MSLKYKKICENILTVYNFWTKLITIVENKNYKRKIYENR